jgi:hypothetical protein
MENVVDKNVEVERRGHMEQRYEEEMEFEGSGRVIPPAERQSGSTVQVLRAVPIIPLTAL